VNKIVEERERRVAGLSGGHEMKVRVGSLTKATWRDRIQERGHRVKSLICEEFQEAMGRVNRTQR
jgi:hypothetical protein